jgi:hypothetical protein
VKKVSNGKRSRKLLLISTAVTILSLASVLTVYAAVFLGTYYGDAVTVHGVASGTIKYNIIDDGSGTWTTNLEPSGAWYTQLDLTGGYTGPVTITWQLQSYATSSWVNVPSATVTTSIILNGGAQDVYAKADGTLSGSRNWALDATTGGTYRVIATINSVS